MFIGLGQTWSKFDLMKQPAVKADVVLLSFCQFSLRVLAPGCIFNNANVHQRALEALDLSLMYPSVTCNKQAAAVEGEVGGATVAAPH